MATIKHNDFWFDDDKNLDYTNEIKKAVEQGDYKKAAYLEKSRNTKIDYYGMPYAPTFEYQNYLEPATAEKSKPGTNMAAVPSSADIGTPTEQMSVLMKNIRGKNFSYDPNKDPLYKSIKENYKKTADDVIENTMGSYAGMTGGMPSSFATSAAAQAGAQHLQKADDMIPELYQLAYNKFADDKNDLYKQYGIMADLEQQKYSRGRDAVADKQWQTTFDYGVERDKVADDQFNMQWQNVLERQTVDDERYLDETAWTRSTYADEVARAEANAAYNRVMTSLQSGMKPNANDIIASGYFEEGTTPEQLLQDYNNGTMNQLRMASMFSGGGSGGGSSTASAGMTAEDLAPFFEMAYNLRQRDSDGDPSNNVGSGPFEYIIKELPKIEADSEEDFMTKVKESLIKYSVPYNLDISEIEFIWDELFDEAGKQWINDYSDVPAGYDVGFYANYEHPEWHGVIETKDLENWQKEKEEDE